MPNYPMYGNNQFYMQDLQAMKDRIDSQMRQIQQQNQMQQQTPQIHQSFQLAPTTNTNELESKYVNNIDEVKNTFVMKTGIFVNKEMNTLWQKNVNGDIRTFKIEEIIEIDEKDKEILMLKKEIEDMKGMIANANESQYINSIPNESDGKSTTNRVSTNKKSNAK